VIICPNCGKENQDRHKFCLGCGARLPATPPPYQPAGGGFPQQVPIAPPPPPAGPTASPFGTRTVPNPVVPTSYSQPDVVAPPGPPPGPPPPLPNPMAAPPPPPPPMQPMPATGSGPTAAGADGLGPCPNCSFANPPGFAFCGRCGFRLVVEPAAPAPAEDVGSANTVFVDQAPPELRNAAAMLRGQSEGSGAKEFPNVSTSAGPPKPVPAPSATPPPPPPGRASPKSVVAAEAPTAPTPSVGVAAKLIMLGPDGQPIGERLLSPGEMLEVGRDSGPPWDEDAYLDRRHGTLIPVEEGIEIVDHDSLNGIFVKLTVRAELQDGDQFRVGQELLRYDDLPEPTPTDDGTERMGSPNPGYWGRLSLLVDPESSSAAYPIHGDGITLGRESGDITFPADGYVSGSHCRIYGDDNGVYVEDVGSSNGTYMRVRSGSVLPYGSLVLIGQKLFQFDRA